MLLDELRGTRPGAIFENAENTAWRLAHEITKIVPSGRIIRFEDYPDRFQFRIVSDDGWRLRRIVLGRESLEKLAADPHRDVKIEYLKRDLTLAASTRRTWSYPRTLALR